MRLLIINLLVLCLGATLYLLANVEGADDNEFVGVLPLDIHTFL